MNAINLSLFKERKGDGQQKNSLSKYEYNIYIYIQITVCSGLMSGANSNKIHKTRGWEISCFHHKKKSIHFFGAHMHHSLAVFSA